jgi:hypothetical protein
MENLNRASQKMEMLARMLAETGVKESVLQVHALLIRHQDQARTVQLRGKWTPVNPQEWKSRTDLTVRVGLGTGSEEEKRNKLQLLSGLQAAVMQTLMTAPSSVYEKAYTMFADVAKTLSIETPEKYAIAPMGPEHQQILQERQAAQQAAQQQPGGADLSKAAQIQAEANMRVKAAEDQFKRDKANLEAQMQTRDNEAERRHLMLIEQMRQMGLDNRAAMAEEVKMAIAGMRADLGRQGISAGVQGAPGFAPAMQAPQQTMPPDGMGA